MMWAVRSVAAGVMACSAAVAAAAGWSLSLADGRQVSIVADGSAGEGSQILERRNPDGSLDRQFGNAGRVVFSLGADSPGPRSIRNDSSGRLLVVGAAMGAGGRAVPGTLRFLPSGTLDLSWGIQGRALIPAADGESVGVDLLPLPDGTVLVLGQIEGESAEQAALWHLGANGAVDTGFGDGGVMRATGLELSDSLGLQLDDDGAALVAVMTVQQGLPWLEVHRWQVGQDQPQRVARQPMPSDWQGPVTLARRGGAWQWFDASQPFTNGGVPLVAVAAAAVWGSTAANVPGFKPAPQVNASEGGAAWNPFSIEAAKPPVAEVDIDGDGAPWVTVAVVSFMALAGVVWWRWPRTQPTHAQRPRAVPPLAKAEFGNGAAPRGAGRGQITRWRERYLQARQVRAERGLPRAAAPAAASALAGPPQQNVPRAAWPGLSASHQQAPECAATLPPLPARALKISRHRVLFEQLEGNHSPHSRLVEAVPVQSRSTWLKVLKQIDRETPRGTTLHLICQGSPVQRRPAVRAWLARHPRFKLHFAAGSAHWPSAVKQLLRDAPQATCLSAALRPPRQRKPARPTAG